MNMPMCRPMFFLVMTHSLCLSVSVCLSTAQVYSTNLTLKPDKNKMNLDYAREYGYQQEWFDSFVNLDLALRCDGFIGTLSSNWCFIIDVLRATLRCKAGGVYIDPSQDQPYGSAMWGRR
jgi:hypothetical protein